MNISMEKVMYVAAMDVVRNITVVDIVNKEKRMLL